MDVPTEMIALKDELWPTLLATPSVQGMDIGLRVTNGTLGEELCFRIFVEDLSHAPSLPDFGAFPVQVLQEVPGTLLVDDTPHRPIEGGVSISCAHGKALIQSGAGTLGGIVFDSVTRELLGLGCAHVLAARDSDAQIDDPCFQPQISAAFPNLNDNRIGKLKRWTYGQTPPLFPPAPPINFTDAAVCTLEHPATMSISEVGLVTGTRSAHPEMTVRKRGRTTELTHGIVEAVFRAYFHKEFGEWFVDQIVIRPDSRFSSKFSDFGDSGSLVVTEVGGTVEVVGLLWLGLGGRGMACDIGTTCSELGVSFV